MKSDRVLLHENSKGVKIVREDMKKRSKVCVLGLDGTSICTYRFNNVPEYKHPYLSWENLDHCGGWATDDSYLLTAVHNGKKPAAQYVIYESAPKIETGNGVETYYTSRHGYYGYTINQVYITRTCSLKDLFDIDSIIDAYKKHDIWIDKEDIMPYMQKPIMDLMKEDFFLNPADDTELVITGLMLGYPIESTASIIFGY